MCNCYSYNGDVGTEPEVILNPNQYFNWGGTAKTVCVDACIANQIKKLWETEIWTRGCCCGHNKKFGNPNVILDSRENFKTAMELLENIDPFRKWDIYR